MLELLTGRERTARGTQVGESTRIGVSVGQQVSGGDFVREVGLGPQGRHQWRTMVREPGTSPRAEGLKEEEEQGQGLVIPVPKGWARKKHSPEQ